jgi:hypothetical protein
MYHVYILYSPSADKYYVGQTSDLDLRLQYHNELNPDSYTSKHRPWELVYIGVEVQGFAYAFKVLAARIYIDTQVPVCLKGRARGFIPR